jgi:hypothetical protein
MKNPKPPKTTGKYKPGNKVFVEVRVEMVHKNGKVWVVPSSGEWVGDQVNQSCDAYYSQSDLERWNPDGGWIHPDRTTEAEAKLAKLRVKVKELKNRWEPHWNLSAEELFEEMSAAILDGE